MYSERHAAELQRASEVKELKDGAPFKEMPFEMESNCMRGHYQWARTRTRLEAVRAALLAEVDGHWLIVSVAVVA